MRPLLTGTRVWSRGTADASTTADCADRRLLPAEVRQTILAAKREHPPLNVHEPTTIRWARCDHRPSSHTGKRILAESPPPPRTHRRFPPYHAIADPSQRRLAIVRLLVEGWNAKSIAAYLETSRQTVHATLKRWAEEEFAGMPDRSRAPHRPATKVTLRAMTTVKELQENPLLGEFRIHAALNRKLYGLPKPEPVLRGTTQLLTVLDRLGVAKHEIAPRQAWQNYVEALFGVQRRMADWGFAHAGSWSELLAVHDLCVADYNDQDHFAHQERPEDRRSPAAVLHRVCGKLVAPEELHRIFYSTRFGRVLDRAGYARFRRWRVYAERGLVLQPQIEGASASVVAAPGAGLVAAAPDRPGEGAGRGRRFGPQQPVEESPHLRHRRRRADG